MTEFLFPSFFALRKNNRRFWRDPEFGSGSVECSLFHGFPIVSYCSGHVWLDGTAGMDG